jgi:glycoside hydrolase-like protein
MSLRGCRPSHPLALHARAAICALALLACWQGALAPSGASARVVHFQGQRVEAPRSWPVYRLSEHPHMCVRLDRRAVYLGTPAANQRCPAEAVGRRRAVLVEPRSAARGSRSAIPIPGRATAGASAGGGVFTGLGFDACTAPSSRSMAAWGSSPYRAIGVYIGGLNRGCSQPNLTASWVSAQTAAGWHLIPTYVGLQAPTSSCSSCAKLSASQATAQGVAGASDAVAQASAVGIGPGSPIYFDMESYSRTSSATAATLAFLEAWTEKLHSLGYVSGVYSSSASGIADLGDQAGSGYSVPDDLWIASWNGQQDTVDPYVPASAWSQHQRIHQYQGGHNETYGGVTINVDNDYVDGATVGTAAPSAENSDPVGFLDLVGSPSPGQLRVRGWALDRDAPTQPLAIRVYVGGRPSAPGALQQDLGTVATLLRPDVGARYRQAGSQHGFDVGFPTVKSGPQPICVYALNTGPGTDRLLGCKAATIPVAITLSHLKATATGIHVRLACEWPAGTQCPGQLVLRARLRLALHHRRGRPPRTRVVTRSLGRRTFRLTGGQAHGFRLAFSAQGRSLLRDRGRLKTQLIAAIPGGRRIIVLGVGRRAG